jgi:hypothetical protein
MRACFFWPDLSARVALLSLAVPDAGATVAGARLGLTGIGPDATVYLTWFRAVDFQAATSRGSAFASSGSGAVR